jgi:hypothetical protein
VWYHIENPYAAVTIGGEVHVPSAPTTAKVVVAWETGYNLPDAGFVIFGQAPLVQNGGGYPGYNLNFVDTLPRVAVTLDTIAKTAIAVGHLFLIDDATVQDGTIIKLSDIQGKYKLLGTGVARGADPSSGLVSVVFRIGKVVTPAYTIKNDNSWINNNSIEGTYTFLASIDDQGIQTYPIGLFPSSHFDINDRSKQGSQDYQLWLR